MTGTRLPGCCGISGCRGCAYECTHEDHDYVPSAVINGIQTEVCGWCGNVTPDLAPNPTAEIPAGPDSTASPYADLLATLWLYVNWRHVTRQLTTEQKRLFADAVDASSDGPVAERWWDWPSCTVCTQPVEERDGRWFDLRGLPGQAEPINWAGVGLTPPHTHTVEVTP